MQRVSSFNAAVAIKPRGHLQSWGGELWPCTVSFCFSRPVLGEEHMLLSPSPGSSQAQHVPDLGFRGKGIAGMVQKLQLLLPRSQTFAQGLTSHPKARLGS